MLKDKQFIFGSSFEEDYLIRTLGVLATSPDVALTELVANAWDAGASAVNIIIPTEKGQALTVEDNGTGLTKDEFYARWMKLGYNRVKHQDERVNFSENAVANRMAYGRNGIGRHGLLCFNSEYIVTTRAKKSKSIFVISTRAEEQPFVVKNASFEKGDGHGTHLEVIVQKNLPDPDRMLDVISARFLHDPQFIVKINGKSVPLEKHSGLVNTRKIKVGKVNLELCFIDSQKAARSTLYQGVAFWQSGRLVGEPSWFLGSESVLDGRTQFAKRYTVVVKTNDLAKEIAEDWTGFKKSDVMKSVYGKVSDYVIEMFTEMASERREETKAEIKNSFKNDFKELSPLGMYEVEEAIEEITKTHPMARPESVNIAVETVIKLEKTRSGKALLQKLLQLSTDDIDGLNRLLEQWSIKDALTVLDEIDRRISVIEAIRKLSSETTTDELKTLHPLVTEARWVFGPEFDTQEYISNKQLTTAAKEIFKKKLPKGAFVNERKRPDLILLDNSTLSLTGVENFDTATELAVLSRILIIELKKGGFEIKREERDQATGYVEDFVNAGLAGMPEVRAFVVGHKISGKVSHTATVQENGQEKGRVNLCTYAQLVDTASRRLFRLKEKLTERYEEITGVELFKKVVQQDFDNQLETV